MPVQPAPAISTTGLILLVIGALYVGREIFVPLALAILLSFVLAPPMLFLRRHGVPRIGAVVMVALLAFSIIASVAVAVGAQLVQLANDLPTYQRNIAAKVSGLRASAPGAGLIERVTGTLENLQRQLNQSNIAADHKPQPAQETAKREPVPVVIEQGPTQPLQLIQSVLGPLIGPLATAGLVVVFVLFILIEREELRDRFIKLAGGSDLQRSTEAITEAARRVSRYLLMQLVVNVTYGIPIGVGLFLIGVPNAMLWGVLAAVLRFIPYLGPWIAAVFPIALAFGVDPGWWMLLSTIALFVVVELISNNAVEPWLYGSSTGLSSFAIILAAIFWTLLWGPVGLFLATPLTVCLVVIGRYVPTLEFLGVALGSDPVLTPAERFYQRLLAGNIEEAIEMAEDHVEAENSLAFYDGVAMPALRLAENDRQRSADVGARRSIADVISAVAREMGNEHARDEASSVDDRTNQSRKPKILCVGARTELDHAAAELLASRLGEIGYEAETIAPIAVSLATIDQLDIDGVGAACFCYLQPNPQSPARYVFRRLERSAPSLVKIACCLNLAGGQEATRELEARLGSRSSVATSFAAAEQRLAEALERRAPLSAPVVGEADLAGLAALRALELTSGKGPAFEWLSREVTRHFDTAVVVVTLDEETASSQDVATEDAAAPPSQSLGELVRKEVERADAIVAVENVSEDERFEADKQLLEKGIGFFAGAPLKLASGATVGALCIFDGKPRRFGDKEREIVHRLVDGITRQAASLVTGKQQAEPRRQPARPLVT